MMMGHGEAGRFTIGSELKYDNSAAIAQFERLRPFTNPAITHAYIFGCEVAADGPCVPKEITYLENGHQKTATGCLGQFSGSTGKPGYFLLSQLADAMNAPVTACIWKLPIDGGWQVGANWKTVPLLDRRSGRRLDIPRLYRKCAVWIASEVWPDWQDEK